MQAPLRVSIDLHNLSGSHTEVRRAGIQQVVFHTLKALLTFEDPRVEFFPVLRLPLSNPGETPFFRPTHFNASDLVLKATIEELGLTVSELCRRWPHLGPLFQQGLPAKDYEDACFQAIASTDLLFEVALCDIRNVVDGARRLNPALLGGTLVHDLGPVRYPEFMDVGMYGWFTHQYMECLRSVDFTVSVSRHTALDLLERQSVKHPRGQNTYYAPLPFVRGASSLRDAVAAELQKWPELVPQRYVVSVATLEPRKNLGYLIAGFRRFRALFPEASANVKLVLVGGSGWRNQELAALVNQDPTGILCTGYVSDAELDALTRQALCLVMPSHYEGFGLPLVQAREAGLPVITCANSSLPEASSLEAVYVRPWLEDDLACALAEVLRRRPTAPLTSPVFPETLPTGWDDLLRRWCDIFLEVRSFTGKSAPQADNGGVEARRFGDAGFDVSRASLFAGTLESGGYEGSAARRLQTANAWAAPFLTEETAALSLDALLSTTAGGQALAASLGQAESFSAMTARNGGELKVRLLSSRVFYLASLCRLEAIYGLDLAVAHGLRLVAVVGDKMTSSALFSQFCRGLGRWAERIVCDSAKTAAAVAGHLDGSKVPTQVDPALFEHFACKNGLAGMLYLLEHYG